MTTAETEFNKWFVDSLAALRNNGDAGFIFVFTAFPLLERYLRRKSAVPDGQNLTSSFYTSLGIMFPEVTGQENQFWDCYRNGLLHHGTFPSAKLTKNTGIWMPLPESGISGHDPRPVYYLNTTNQFYMNPIAFFDAVSKAILSDFATYEGSLTSHYDLPVATNPTTPFSNIVTTIGLGRTGVYKP